MLYLHAQKTRTQAKTFSGPLLVAIRMPTRKDSPMHVFTEHTTIAELDMHILASAQGILLSPLSSVPQLEVTGTACIRFH